MRTLPILFIGLVLLFRQPESDAGKGSLDLPRYSLEQLQSDFDLLVSSLKEAHTGLYWYSTEQQFDSVVTRQRSELRDGLDGLQFYNVVAPIVAFTREDHCDIYLSPEIDKALEKRGLFLPLYVVHLGGNTLILNEPIKGKHLQGSRLTAVNGIGIEEIRRKIFASFAADGFILSSKYRYLDFRGFSREYAKVMGQQKVNSITVLNPATGEAEQHLLRSVSAKGLRAIGRRVREKNAIRRETDRPGQLEMIPKGTAVLTFTTFSNKKFERCGMGFRQFVDSVFTVLSTGAVQNLIIDIRDNGGGSEGNEDYLFSYLYDQPYTKYRYVQAPGLTFSFLEHTDYASREDREELENELREENQQMEDGKYYRKPGLYVPEPVRDEPFPGRVYVLTSGWTYSGGAEFASLMKEHTRAVFVGEETGGGYYGNTSGTSLELRLPHTGLMVDIPLLKFVLDVRKGIFGRGAIPDHEVQPTFEEFIRGYDAELEFAKGLIERNDRR